MPSLSRRTSRHIATVLSVAALLSTVLLVVALPRAARTDDKYLLVGGGCEGPNIFSLLDISSSMKKWVDRPAWATTQWATANHDGEDSRYHQVREALYTVLKGTSGVHFGFAQFPNITRHGLSYSCSTIRVEDPDNPGTEIIETCSDTRDGYCCSRGLDHELDWEENDDVSACRGLEPNGDDDIDSLAFDDGTLYYNFLCPTEIDVDSGLETGDLLPINWTDDNRMALMR